MAINIDIYISTRWVKVNRKNVKIMNYDRIHKSIWIISNKNKEHVQKIIIVKSFIPNVRKRWADV